MPEYIPTRIFPTGKGADGGGVNLELQNIKNVINTDANTTTKGVLETSTDAEARAKSSSSVALTPSNLAGIRSVVSAYIAANPTQSIPDATETRIAFDTEKFDTRGEFTTGVASTSTAGYFTAEEDGEYVLIGSALFTAIAVTTSMVFSLVVHIDTGGGWVSSDILQRKTPEANNTEYVNLTGSTILQLNAGDKVALAAFHTRGSALGLFVDTSGKYQRFMIHRIN